jgi:hypothetical protein
MTNGRENRNHGNEEKGEGCKEEEEIAAIRGKARGRASAPFAFGH